MNEEFNMPIYIIGSDGKRKLSQEYIDYEKQSTKRWDERHLIECLNGNPHWYAVRPNGV